MPADVDSGGRSWNLDSPLDLLRGVGPVRSRALAESGYRTVLDLLWHLPSRYEDRRNLERIADLGEAGDHLVEGTISELQVVRIRRRRLSLVRGVLDDGSGRLDLVWFNRPYLAEQIDPQATYRLYGRLRRARSGVQLLNPSCDRVDSENAQRRIVPVYPTITGLGPALVRRLQQSLLDEIDLAREIEDDLPDEILERRDLVPLGEALAWLHCPPAEGSIEALVERTTAAHRRLIYGEFLDLQLEIALRRRELVQVRKSHAYVDGPSWKPVAAAILPFRLTAAQQRVVDEIVGDLRGVEPMLRLLQGDVGSGKTIVAALAVVVALESGLQAAFMAPTELLAEQHYRTLSRLLGSRYRIALLTGSTDGAPESAKRLSSGDIQLVIGTHALIQRRIEFSRLGLAVIDEQHRFGVAQRQLLQEKGDRPDMLVMTATPIPRSLALTAYGDLELSVIDEMPPGRQAVRTRVEPERRRREAYRWLASRVRQGAQAYVVAPLIGSSGRLRAASVESAATEASKALGNSVEITVLHGRLPAEERERIMEEFTAGRVRVLVATTIVEVGVDVPAATVMLIESAERFGLAQLHQLRGRVGRGKAASACIALHGRLTEDARRRLAVFAESEDGFEIAEADMDIRGPGELLGTRQAGLPRFRIAHLVADRDLLLEARTDARRILADRLESVDYRPLLKRIEASSKRRSEPFGGG